MAGNLQGNGAFERMRAMRLFAQELKNITITVPKKSADQYESQLYLSQTGLKVSRVMIVGTATEVEDIGSGDSSFFRMRVSDPTGVFFVTAGQYQPEAARVLQELAGKVPVFVAVIGKISIYTPTEGSVLTSIRAEQVAVVDENTRDTWLLETAKATLDRLSALKSGSPLLLEVDTAYPNKEDYKLMVKNVLMSMKTDVGSPASSPAAPPASPPAAASPPEAKPAAKGPDAVQSDGTMSIEDMKNFVEQKIISMNKGKKGVKLEMLGNPCKGAGMTLIQLETALKGLMDEGRIYEPKVGLLMPAEA